MQTKNRIIGNHKYEVRQLGTSEAEELLVRLVRVLGPVLGALLEDVGGGIKSPKGIKSLLDMDVTTVSKALHELGMRLTVEDLRHLRTVFGNASVCHQPDGKALPMKLEYQELHWCGRISDMFKWLGFCLEVNYSDFFGGAGLISKAVGAVAEVKPSSPSPSQTV